MNQLINRVYLERAHPAFLTTLVVLVWNQKDYDFKTRCSVNLCMRYLYEYFYRSLDQSIL